jgi:hypothetical protein
VPVAVPGKVAVARVSAAVGEMEVGYVAEAQAAGCYRPQGEASNDGAGA